MRDLFDTGSDPDAVSGESVAGSAASAGARTRGGQDRRRHPRRPCEARAILRLGAATSLFGRVVDVSQGGACIEFPQPIQGRTGEWVVLDGDEPFKHGFDAFVVAVEDRRWRIAFDSALVLLGIFAPTRAGRSRASSDGAHTQD